MAGGLGLLVPVGVLLALLLPYVVYSLVSNDAVRETKLLAQGLGASLVFLGLGNWISSREAPSRLPGPGPLVGLFGAAMGLVAVSGFVHAGGVVDPLAIVPVLAPLALFVAGAFALGEEGGTLVSRATRSLAVLAAGSGALVFAQRFLGVFRWPGIAKDGLLFSRSYATALIGNPGDVGTALAIPFLLLWVSIFRSPSNRATTLRATGLLLTGLGLVSSTALTAIVAVGAGIALHVLLVLSGRTRRLAVLAILLFGTIFASGRWGRVPEKIADLLTGRFGAAASDRDVGLFPAIEMVRDEPLLGVGPGAFSNAFIPARMRAEERLGRRLLHSTEGHFDNAHFELLTVAAECGAPAALLFLAFALGLLFLLGNRALLESPEERAKSGFQGSLSATTLFVALFVFLILSLGTFPFRIAISSGPAAFLAGLALRRVGNPIAADPKGRRFRVAGWVFGAAGVLLGILSVMRAVAVYRQGLGEAALVAMTRVPARERPAIQTEARREFLAAASLRPRRPQTWLSLGALERQEGNLDAAWESTLRSFRLEERAETAFNLAAIAGARGDRELSAALFRRAVWVEPRLFHALPAAGPSDPNAIHWELHWLDARFPRYRKGYPLPAALATAEGGRGATAP